jgi:leader peptidase (prepilin peptidase)/N-methyltransferase
LLLLPEPAASLFVAAVGLVLGSFLNVCIYRLPLGESIVSPRSRCPGCATPITWYRNIPVLSWLLLRGRCADCGRSISWRYPLVEAASAVVLLLLWHDLGATPAFVVASAFTLAMLVLFFTDFDHQLLPDAVTLSGCVSGLALAWFNPFLPGTGWSRVWASCAGAALGAGLLWGVGAVYSKWRKVEAMGMGDVKMMAMVGSFTGPVGVLFTIFAASVSGAIVGLLLIPIAGRTLQHKLPFGCFLAPAAVGAMLYGRQAMAAYFRLLLPPVEMAAFRVAAILLA